MMEKDEKGESDLIGYGERNIEVEWERKKVL